MVGPLNDGDPRRLGRYALEGRIGAGGQGVVYLGRDGDGARVAVKVLLNTDDPADRARFVREAHNAKRVARFCTAQVLEIGDADGRPYVVSEYIEGPTLQEVVAGGRVLGGSELERLAISMATALVSIHKAGVVHRDFKPGNVIMGRDGPRVIDFGIARTLGTMTSGVIGTPSFMAPEQWSGRSVGPASDVWAWAATVVFAASGRQAFQADTIPELYARIAENEPFVPPLGPPLRPLLEAAFTKDPARRPSMQQILDRLLTPETAEPAPMAAPPPPGPDIQRPVPPQGYAPSPVPSQGQGPGYPSGTGQWAPASTHPQGRGGQAGGRPARRGRSRPVLIALACAAVLVPVIGFLGVRALSPGDDQGGAPKAEGTAGGAPRAEGTAGGAVRGTQVQRTVRAGTYRIDRELYRGPSTTITLNRIEVSSAGKLTVRLTYRNTATLPQPYVCTGYADPDAHTLTLPDGSQIRSIESACSADPSKTWTVGAGETFESYAVFSVPADLPQPFTFTWYPGRDNEGSAEGITLRG